MPTKLERESIMNGCKKLEIDRWKCDVLINNYFNFTTINEEVEFWLKEKSIELKEEHKDRVIEEAVSRADRMWEEEIEDIVEETKW